MAGTGKEFFTFFLALLCHFLIPFGNQEITNKYKKYEKIPTANNNKRIGWFILITKKEFAKEVKPSN
jgi:hypothetical protein